MRFQTWIQTAKDLMDMIKLIPNDYPEMIQEYNSTPFSIRYNTITRSTTFKRSVSMSTVVPQGTHVHQISTNPSSIPGTGPTTVGIASVSGNVTLAGPITVNAPMYNPNAITTVVNEDNIRLNVSITVRDGELIDIKFINKNINSFSFTTENTEDGGRIEHTMLYIGSDKMIYNGVLYDLNSPDAFTHDISTDTDVSIMDLFYLKEYYENNGRP